MEEMTRKEKDDWFEKLRTQMRPDSLAGYTKTCLCGDVFWYATGQTDPAEVHSWIDKHIDCKPFVGKPLPRNKANPTIKDLYDFSKPVKFSREGLAKFIEIYGLKLTATNGRAKREHYTDKFENVFCFYFPQNVLIPDLYAEIVPELTEVSNYDL